MIYPFKKKKKKDRQAGGAAPADERGGEKAERRDILSQHVEGMRNDHAERMSNFHATVARPRRPPIGVFADAFAER